jgi:hypothetical protein
MIIPPSRPNPTHPSPLRPPWLTDAATKAFVKIYKAQKDFNDFGEGGALELGMYRRTRTKPVEAGRSVGGWEIIIIPG